MSKNHSVNIKNIPQGTRNSNLDKIGNLVSTKLDCLIIHAGTIKKISPIQRCVFQLNCIKRQKKNWQKCTRDKPKAKKLSQKGINYIENTRIKEIHLQVRMLHLNKKGNSVFAKKSLCHKNILLTY